MPASRHHPKKAESDASTELFAGKYRMIRLLGKGAMGEVWLAEEEGPRNFRRRVAVKRLSAKEEIGDYARESFFAEAQVIARLDHPNVVRLIELGTADGAAYLVLDYVDGPAIDRMLRRVGPFSPRAVAYIGREVARALEAVHSLSDEDGRSYAVVHRDVSPSNILLARDGRVRLTDFGVARISGLADQQAEAGVFKGKLAYMPPEQARGEPFDGRADVFSLGLTLLEAMLGRRVRRAETQTQLIMSVASMPVARARELLPDLPPALADALDAATEFDAAKRTPDASIMAASLERALAAMGDAAEQEARRELRECVDVFIKQADTASGSGSRKPPPLAGVGRVLSDAGRSAPPPSLAPPPQSGRSPASVAGSRSAPPSRPRPSTPPVSHPPPSVHFLDFDGPEDSIERIKPRPLEVSAPEEELRIQRDSSHRHGAVALTAAPRAAEAAASVSAAPRAAEAAASVSAAPRTDDAAAPPADDEDELSDEALLAEQQRRRRIFFSGLGVLAGLVVLRLVIALVMHLRSEQLPNAPGEPGAAIASATASAPPPAALASASAEPSVERHASSVAGRRAGPSASGQAVEEAKQGALQVVALPWADVTIDGRKVGTTPIPAILLAPGPHSVVLRNAELGAVRRFSVVVKAGAPTLLRVDLRRTR